MNGWYIKSIIFLLISMMLSAACEREEFIWGIKVGNITYSGNVVFLGKNELALLKDISDERMIFSGNTGEIEKITDMSILVVGLSENTPYGLLRKVRSIRTDGNEVTIETVNANLAEAVKEGTVTFRKKLLEEDFTLKSKADGVLLKGPSKSFDGLAVTLDNFEIYNDGTRIATLDGAIGISPEINITIIISSNKIIGINLNTSLNKIDELTLSSDGAFSGGEEIVASEFVHAPIIIDSLIFIPEVRVSCGFEGSISCEVTSGVRQDRVITSKMSFANLIWSEDPLTHLVEFDFFEPQITDNSDLEIYSGPEIDILLFGSPIQTVKAKGFYSLKADKTGTPFWRLFIGSNGQNTVKADILGLREDHIFALEIEPSEISNGGDE